MTDLIRIPFHGSELQAMLRQGEGYLVLRAACEDLGIDPDSQRKRLVRQAWATTVVMTSVAADAKQREVFCLHADSVPMWLATIQASRVRSDRRELLVIYQKECARVLREHFAGRAAAPETDLRTIIARIVREELAAAGAAAPRVAARPTPPKPPKPPAVSAANPILPGGEPVEAGALSIFGVSIEKALTEPKDERKKPCDVWRVYVPDRSLNEILKAAGGYWFRGGQCWSFYRDPRAKLIELLTAEVQP